MDSNRKNEIVNQTISGIIYYEYSDHLYRLEPPTKGEMAMANMIYSQVLNDNKFENLITREKANFILQRDGTWTSQNDVQLKAYEKSLEDLKIKLYKSLYNKKERDRTLKSIKRQEKIINKAYEKKYSLDPHTLEFFAEKTREEFLTAICIKDENNKNVYTYKNFRSTSNVILNIFLSLQHKHYIKTEEYREIARTEPFRSLWSISKENVFGVPACYLTNNQKNLILYSKMYDNVYESTERPSEEVINNDYMLDGWFALQRREADADRKRSEADALLNKKGTKGHGNAGELFVVADSFEEAAKIRELNDLEADIKIKQKVSAIKEAGELEEHNLPDVKMDLRNQARQQILNRGKG